MKITMETTTTYTCEHCGKPPHTGRCPRIKSVEYRKNGTIKRVEYFGLADYWPGINVEPTFKPPYTITWGGTSGSIGDSGSATR